VRRKRGPFEKVEGGKSKDVQSPWLTVKGRGAEARSFRVQIQQRHQIRVKEKKCCNDENVTKQRTQKRRREKIEDPESIQDDSPGSRNRWGASSRISHGARQAEKKSKTESGQSKNQKETVIKMRPSGAEEGRGSTPPRFCPERRSNGRG